MPGDGGVSSHGSGAVSPSGAPCHTPQHFLRHLMLWGFATHYLRSFIPSGFKSVENHVQEQLISILCSTNAHLPPHHVEDGLG